jgi:hypothetical protein
MRTVWVSFDTIGRDCLEAAAGAGAEIVGVVTLPGPIDPNRSGQCSFDEVAARLGASLIETRDISPETLNSFELTRADLRRGLVAARAGIPFIKSPGGVRHASHALAETPRTCTDSVGDPRRPRAHGRDALRDRRRYRRLQGVVGRVVLDIARTRRPRRSSNVSRKHMQLTRELVPRLVARTAPPSSGSEPCELVAEAHPGRRHHRLEDPCAVPPAGCEPGRGPPGRSFLGAGVIVWGARPSSRGSVAAGTIVELSSAGPVVACGEGGLVLEGSRRT